MAIQPISSRLVNSQRSLPSFKAKQHRDNAEPDYMPRSQSGLKKVPVIVLMAMSPLVAAPGNSIANSGGNIPYVDKVEQLDQTPRTKSLPTEVIREGFHVFDVFKITTDDDDSNAELLLIRYHAISEGGYEKIMDAQIKAFCIEPEQDGSHIVALREFRNKGNELGKYRLVRVPPKFGQYLNKFIFSDQNTRLSKNDWAVLPGERQSFIDDFGANAVKNAPLINQATKRILYEDGTEKIIGGLEQSNMKHNSSLQLKGTYNPRIIKSRTLSYDNVDMYYKINLISTDNDDSNYEEIEITRSLLGDITNRGMIKSASLVKYKDGSYFSYVNGIPLSVRDLDDYNVNHEKRKVFSMTAAGPEIYEELGEILSSPANNSGVVPHRTRVRYSPQQSFVDQDKYMEEHNLTLK